MKQAACNRVPGSRTGVPAPLCTPGGQGGGGGAGGAAAANTAVGKPVAIQFRGRNIDKAKHTGRWVIVKKVGCGKER